MVGDPRDRTAYRIAIASLGITLALLLLCICWIVTQQSISTDALTHRCTLEATDCQPALYLTKAEHTPGVPWGLWAALVTLGGLFVGALIPLPLPVLPPRLRWPENKGDQFSWDGLFLVAALLAFFLGALFIGLGSEGSLRWLALGGLLLGLLIPSPAQGD